MNDINDEGVTAILGLVLMTHPDREVRIPIDLIESGLPANSGVQVFQDHATEELVVRVQEFKEKG